MVVAIKEFPGNDPVPYGPFKDFDEASKLLESKGYLMTSEGIYKKGQMTFRVERLYNPDTIR